MLQKWLILIFGLGIWIVDRYLSSSSLTESLFLVDTLAFVKKLEGQGVASNQPEAITTAITQVLIDSFENVSHSFVSKGEMQKIEMIQESNLSKFKSHVQSSQLEKLKPVVQQISCERICIPETMGQQLSYPNALEKFLYKISL
ncbi:hypothetical protein UlMin_037523 [Ulmus minor]